MAYIDDIDREEVISNADDRGIGLICYINKIAMSRYDLDHTFKIYKEDPSYQKLVAMETLSVTSAATIKASMSSGSGHAIRIYPAGSQ